MEAADNRNRGYGDGLRMHGVRSVCIVEIKNWREGVSFYKVLKVPKEEAMMMHDLARLCSDPAVEDRKLVLNFESIVRSIGGDLPLNVDKAFLTKFLQRHPVAGAGLSAKERADAVKQAVVKLAPVALAELKEIVRQQSWRGGRQRTDLQEIPPDVQVDDLVRENEQLKARIIAMEARDKERNDAFMAVHQELYAARERASANPYPFKRAFAEREEIILPNDSDADVSGSQWIDMLLN